MIRKWTVTGGGGRVIVEMDEETFRALGTAVVIAFEDESSVPEHYQEIGTQLWNFFAKGEQQL